jgi:hypothetical protein
MTIGCNQIVDCILKNCANLVPGIKDKAYFINYDDVDKDFDIKAPASGMVIYQREWNGQKRTVGSEINTWDLTVAELPDLSTLVSRTYVNEIDIAKVKKNQSVEIGVDAFPDKKYKGKVISIANIGQELPNTNVKVFEVEIELLETDPLLLPAMTSQNTIKVFESDSIIQIPQAYVLYNDTFQFVIKKTGKKIVRKEIKTGWYNSTKVELIEGLSIGDIILFPNTNDGINYPVERLKSNNKKK